MFRTAAGEGLPPHVETALCEIFGSSVKRVRLVPNSWYARLHGRAAATTRRNVIYLRGSLASFAADPALVLHEYFHVIHQWRSRRLTIRRYLLEWLKHGYWNNRFEREARDFTSAQHSRLVAMLEVKAKTAPLAVAVERQTDTHPRRTLQSSKRSA